MSEWRARRNERALTQLERARPDVFPGPVLVHALAQPWTPALPRLAVESYWRAHPLRADRLARRLAAQSGMPDGWSWRVSRDNETRLGSFRTPPAPYREARWHRGPGFCCLCGQMVFRFGWHRDLWQAGAPNTRAHWHAACVTAWKLWNAPGEHLRLLSRLQGRRCAVTGKRLLRSAEADHRVPLFSVWRDHCDRPWPALLAFWGFPNLQAVNEPAHRAKTALEAKGRAVSHSLKLAPPASFPDGGERLSESHIADRARKPCSSVGEGGFCLRQKTVEGFYELSDGLRDPPSAPSGHLLPQGERGNRRDV